MYKITIEISGVLIYRIVNTRIDAQDVLTGIMFGGVTIRDNSGKRVIQYSPSETMIIRIEESNERATRDFHRI